MKAGSGHRGHHLAPGISDLRKAVQHQHQRAVRAVKTGLKDVHAETVDVIDEPRTDARRQDGCVKRFHWSIHPSRPALPWLLDNFYQLHCTR